MNRALPRGLRIDHGYLQVRLFHKGKMYCKNFGRDDAMAREAASKHLFDTRYAIRSGRFNMERELESRLFVDVADDYLKMWSAQMDAEGLPKHTPASIYNCKLFINNSIKPFFKKYKYDDIKPVDIQKWREFRLKTVLGTSVNREQAVLGSIFSHIATWVKSEELKPAFKLPAEHPCKDAKWSKTRKRERVLSLAELGLLKAACASDLDIWEICKMALKSLLRKKDLLRLEAGLDIDINQAKTGIRVNLPVQVLRPLNYVNFRKRWEAVRKSAGLVDCQFRDLRKTGANLLKERNYSIKLISEFLGHTDTDTTEIYMIPDNSSLAPLASALHSIVESI